MDEPPRSASIRRQELSSAHYVENAPSAELGEEILDPSPESFLLFLFLLLLLLRRLLLLLGGRHSLGLLRHRLLRLVCFRLLRGGLGGGLCFGLPRGRLLGGGLLLCLRSLGLLGLLRGRLLRGMLLGSGMFFGSG